MNRREFIRISGAAAAAVAVGPRSSLSVEESSTSVALASEPVLVNPSADAVTIVFGVNGPATGWVEYGPDEKLGQRADLQEKGFLPFSERVISIRISSLKPGGRIFYRACAAAINFASAYSIKRGDVVHSAVYSFKTLDPAANQSSFTVWNDTHETRPTLAALTASLAKNPTDLLMWNGDVTNDIQDEHKFLQHYLSAGGLPYATSVPLFLGRGNHDVRGKFARQLPEYLSGPDGEYFYTFRAGPLGAIVMDTGEDKPDEMPVYGGLNAFAEYRTRQRAWLQKAIEKQEFKSAKYKIAFLHIPLVWEKQIPEDWWSVWNGHKGWICEDGRAKWEELLVSAGVQLIISGHTHDWAWFAPDQNRKWAQLVGGGPRPQAATTIVGRADQKRLEIVVKNLKGDVLLEKEFPAAG